MDYSPRGHKESDMTERLSLSVRVLRTNRWVWARRLQGRGQGRPRPCWEHARGVHERGADGWGPAQEGGPWCPPQALPPSCPTSRARPATLSTACAQTAAPREDTRFPNQGSFTSKWQKFSQLSWFLEPNGAREEDKVAPVILSRSGNAAQPTVIQETVQKASKHGDAGKARDLVWKS